MVLLEFAIAPVAKGESVSADVARALDIVDRAGLPYQVTAMGTLIEGEWAQVMGVVTRCFEALSADNPRVVVHMRVDYRAGTEGRLTGKIDSVERKLGRKLQT